MLRGNRPTAGITGITRITDMAGGRRPARATRGRSIAVLTGAALAAAACTGGSPARPKVSTTPGLIDEAPTIRPLALGRKPLWSVKDVGTAALHGDTAVFVRTAKGHDRLTAVDAATGRTRWSLSAFGTLRGGGGTVWLGNTYGSPDTPQVVDEGNDWGVLINYFLTACRNPTGFCPVGSGPSDETGLALLSGKDGSVRWKLPLIPARTGKAARSADRLRGNLVAADDKIALAAPRQSGRDLRPLCDLRPAGIGGHHHGMVRAIATMTTG